MQIFHSPYISTFLEAANKKYTVEMKNKNIPLTKIEKLEPVTDLDGRVISYSPYQKNSRHTQPTEYADCFEKMTFEQPTQDVDFWRDDELYVAGKESHPLAVEPYSKDDVQLSDSICHKMYSRYGYNLTKEHYPDTDLSFDDQSTLQLINFTENIVPASFPATLNVKYETIRDFALESVRAWENGISTSKISNLIGKSVLKGGNGSAPTPEVDLLNFLTKHPNDRAIVVTKLADGQEIFDKSAALYYDLFVRKYFADSKVALNVLSECKINEAGIPQANKKLCEIAALLRRKSALGIPEKEVNDYSPTTQKLSGICPIDTPWGKSESALIQKIKSSDSSIDEDYYKEAKKMLQEDKRTVEYVLENIDAVVKRNKDVNEINNKYEEEYPSYNFLSYKKEISSLLKDEVRKNRENQEALANNCIVIDTAKKLQNRNLPIDISYQVLRTADYLSKCNDKDLKTFLNAIDNCTNPQVYSKENATKLTKLCYKLYKETKTFGEEEAKLMDNICERTKDGDTSYISALNTMINLVPRLEKLNLEIADANIDECAKYIRQFNEKIKVNTTYKEHKSFIDSILSSEFNKLIFQDNFKTDDCLIFNKAIDLFENNVPYEEFLEHINTLKSSTK